MPAFTMLVHGYSEQFLTAYHHLPGLLQAAPFNMTNVILTAYDSLDNGVSIDDLADGLELRMVALETAAAAGRITWNTADAVFICHSTGALVVRRWILNRLGTASPLPTHLVTMAGANHGSAVAELGPSILGQIAQYVTKNGRTPGDQVLSDLDFGSAFLLRLNKEWLQWRAGDLTAKDDRLATMAIFSMGGDSLGPDAISRYYWASSERGCDNTVRISAANLNYTYLIADGDKVLQPLPSGSAVPHLIVPGRSHWSPKDGILASIISETDPAMVAIADALAVPNSGDAAYAALAANWAAQNAAWMATSPPRNDQQDTSVTAAMTNADVNGNSTIVFNVHDRFGRSVDDCIITIMDDTVPALSADALADSPNLFADGILRLSSAAESRWPIHNSTNAGSYTFYVNYKRFYDSVTVPTGTPDVPLHHIVTISAVVPGNCVTFETIVYQTTPGGLVNLVQPNQTTYVDVILERDTSASVAFYTPAQVDPNAPAWRPFPPNPIA